MPRLLPQPDDSALRAKRRHKYMLPSGLWVDREREPVEQAWVEKYDTSYPASELYDRRDMLSRGINPD